MDIKWLIILSSVELMPSFKKESDQLSQNTLK